MKMIVLFFCVALHFATMSQKSTVIIKNNKGTINLGDVNENNKTVDVLNIDKHLNIKKRIALRFATNVWFLEPVQFAKGHYDSSYWWPFPGQFLKIKIQNGHLKLRSDIIGFDGKYVAKLRGDTLTPGEHFNRHFVDTTFEIFDAYNIPVLQIRFKKKENAIDFSGVEQSDIQFVVYSSKGMAGHTYSKSLPYKPKSQMTDQELRAALEYYKETCHNDLKAISED
jgi:hypothetical protein